MDKFYRKVHWIKKGTFSRRVFSILMALAMIISLLPMNAMEVKAAEGTQQSVTAYATKDQLMTAFTPNSFGTATTVGKLVFGKNSSGDPQEWYILGKDTGVTGDNTIIFAASPIATGQVFNSSTGIKNDSNLWSDCNYGKASVTEVYANHYGASDLRDTLQTMAANPSYFTTAEQGLMNATTVTTNDTKNGGTYTTTDTLYVLAADSFGPMYTTIKAGTNNRTVLAMNSYWKSGADFWLRLPYVSDDALFADLNNYHCVFNGKINCEGTVRPASNLDLSSVLFASAATAASSDTKSEKITDGTAMTLRLDGNSKNIGTVTYKTTTGDIKAAKGTTSQTVALVVQGKGTVNGEEKDWYYSKQITGTEVVNVTAIVSETNTPESIDLSTCKIWLETTDTTDGMIYAVNATEYIIPVIYTITASADANGSISPSGSVEVTEGEDQTFTITPNAGYEIDTLKVDGKEVEASTSYTFSKVNSAHTIAVTFKAKSVTPAPEPTPGDSDKENVANDTKPDDNAFNTNLNETPSELKDKVLTAEERTKVTNGESASVYLEVTDISASVSDTDKNLVESKKGDTTLGMYIDISLYAKVGTSEPRKVTNTSGAVTITVKVPDNLINTDSAVSRDYQIIRVHEGVASVIPCTSISETGTISFETDAFSTYALAYSDTAVNNTTDKDSKNETVQTGDSYMNINWYLLMIVATGVVTLYFVKKSRRELGE